MVATDNGMPNRSSNATVLIEIQVFLLISFKSECVLVCVCPMFYAYLFLFLSLQLTEYLVLMPVFLDSQDLNDNTPTFDSPSFTVNITEDFSVGTLVFNGIADDPDSSSNGEVTYTLFSTPPQSPSHFTLESPSSGAITTSNTFDYDMGQKSFGMIVSPSSLDSN